MSTSQVVHHTDYRSKAEDRRKELEKLQAKGLAKTQGTFLGILQRGTIFLDLQCKRVFLFWLVIVINIASANTHGTKLYLASVAIRMNLTSQSCR